MPTSIVTRALDPKLHNAKGEAEFFFVCQCSITDSENSDDHFGINMIIFYMYCSTNHHLAPFRMMHNTLTVYLP